VAREIVNFLCGPRGRIKNPVPVQDFKTRDNLYKPEVINYNDGKYQKEDGSPFKGKMLIFNFNTPPLLSGSLTGKIFSIPSSMRMIPSSLQSILLQFLDATSS